MFAQLNPTQSTGQAYDAIDRIVIETPPNADPSITLVTAKRIILDGKTHTLSTDIQVERIIFEQLDPEDGQPPNTDEVFYLRDAATGVADGTSMTYSELASTIYSAVVHIMAKQ